MMKPVFVLSEGRRNPLTQKTSLSSLFPSFQKYSEKFGLRWSGKTLSIFLMSFFISASAFLSVNAQTITGPDTVCVGTTQTYSLNPPQLANWSVTGGNIIGPNSGISVVVQWTGPQNSTQLITANLIPGPGSVSKNILIKNNQMVCQNRVQVSLPSSGFGKIPASDLLMGYYNSYDGFTVNIKTLLGVSQNDTVWCKDIGKTLIAKVTNGCDGNSCWTTISVEDKQAPVLTCSSVIIKVPCNTLFDTLPKPTAVDNCDPSPVVSLSNILVDNSDICGGVKLTRTWIATDKYGNTSSCVDMYITDPTHIIGLPVDTAWECSDYNKYPNIVNPTALTGLWSTTGSGIPDVPLGVYCPYSFKHKDQFLKACGGAFKIIRNWTVIKWCDNLNPVLLHEQIIKVIDRTPPRVEVPPIRISADIKGNLPIECKAITCLPAPGILDECGTWTVKIFTPIGEAIYTCGRDGRDGGRIPPPGLTIGIHDIVYIVTDECGNVTQHTVKAEVVDDKKPVAVCREFVVVNLNNQGIADVYPESFDKGSNDNCCMGKMELKRMSQPWAPFSPSIRFTCVDKKDQVILRVYDCFDNYNDCMAHVTVFDKTKPVCTAPGPRTILCTELPGTITQEWLNTMGSATPFDNCSAEIVEFPHQKVLDSCNAGQIIRSFVAVDREGNFSETCKQFIKVEKAPDWEIIFPPNWEGVCGGKEEAPRVKIINKGGCNLIFTSFNDQLFTLAEDRLCYKIVRTWTVKNQCPDPETVPLIRSNRPAGDTVKGKYNFSVITYQQIIKVMDNTPPKLSYPFASDFCTFDDNCLAGNAFVPVLIDGECSDVFTILYELDLNRDGSIDQTGMGYIEKSLPIGSHRIHYRVKDGCKNESKISVDFRIKDCKHAITVCETGIVAELTVNGTTVVCARQLDAGSYDNCGGPIRFAFSPNPADSCRTFRCSDVGKNIEVQVYTIDKDGNLDFCNTSIIVQDNLFRCDTGIPIVGSISTENNTGLNEVTVNLNNGNESKVTVKTNSSGQFKFENITKGIDYSITPRKNTEPLNGVSTYDLVLISRHILGIDKLNSPYKLLAADANRSGSVTTLDLVELRKLILFINTEFPNNTSWRFVDKNYKFSNPQNPWQEAVPEVVNLNNLSDLNATASFVAVKTGDVNSNASTSNLSSVENRNLPTLTFVAEDLEFRQGQTVSVHLKAKDFVQVFGFQFTLEFDKSKLSFASVKTSQMVKTENFGLAKTDEGALMVSWYESVPVSLQNDETVISLEFIAQKKGRISDVLTISSTYTKAEAYTGQQPELNTVVLKFHGMEDLTQGKFELHQNIPNPFSEKTTIGFVLPESASATLTIFEPTGKKILELSGDYVKGYNEVTLDKTQLPFKGLLYYKLDAPNHRAVKSMTLIGR